MSFYSIVRRGEGLDIRRRAGFRYEHLGYRFKNKLAEPFFVTAPYLEEEQDKPIHLSTHEGQEFDYIKTIENGILTKFETVCPPDFNFAYDVVDEIASKEPERRAMLWCNDKGEEHTFTFGDIKRYSDKTANLLASKGLKKGDTVLLILKRHYEFWFVVLALHKLGVIGIPATNLLTKKDLVFRFNASGAKAVFCTVDGEVAEHVEASLPESPTVSLKFSVRGSRDGWIDFDKELEGASEEWSRVDTKATDTMLIYFTSGTSGMPKMVAHDFSYPLGHIITAKYWQHVVPDGLHLTLSDSGWMKCMWGKLYCQWLMEAGIFVCDFDKFTPSELLPLFYHFLRPADYVPLLYQGGFVQV